MYQHRWVRWAVVVGMGMGSAWADSTPAVALSPQEDLALWHQAGMSFLPPVAEFTEVRDSAEYQRYQALRSQRLLERTAEAAIAQQPTAAVPKVAPAAGAQP